MTKVLYPLTTDMFDWLMRDEGYLSDDTKDAGGLTKYGVSQRAYPNVDIRNLTRDGARVIYEKDYWAAPLIQLLPRGLDYAVFDFGVNSGPGRALRTLTGLTSVGPESSLDSVTLGAVQGLCDRLGKAKVIDMYCDARAKFLTSLNQPRFTKGWLARVERVRVRAKERARG